ncbi:DUF4230 domain-containing protein [Clostridium sp. Marseille-P3244]|uniref:DUF4230 domain-containing protein n=1 Tax=Clostridium sp. Marseille-P3244 TaxID=1871020 RepID=UPI0009316D5F|nr:DUF4230 domain-containing protein [Clostridium sp. Marseille-P3244]
MQENATKKKKNNRFREMVSNLFAKRIIMLLVLLIVIVLIIIGVRRVVSFDNQTTKIGFEDIGEIATQSAYCTQVSVTDSSRKLFGAKIPFTQSKYIYSYGVIIKAGFNFEEIEWSEKENTIEVKLPETKILSSEIDTDSFKVYHEEESIFNQVTLEENNTALKELKQEAEEEAVANGLLDNARSNAEAILTGFFGQVYDLDQYKIVYEDK